EILTHGLQLSDETGRRRRDSECSDRRELAGILRSASDRPGELQRGCRSDGKIRVAGELQRRAGLLQVEGPLQNFDRTGVLERDFDLGQACARAPEEPLIVENIWASKS